MAQLCPGLYFAVISCLCFVACRPPGDGSGPRWDGGPDGDGDVDGDADGDIEGDGDVTPRPEHCPGVELREDGVLDVDLAAVRISGRVTVFGAAPPSRDLPRGELLFEGQRTGASVWVPLEQAGAVEYELVIPPDTYDISLEANPALCVDLSGRPGVPCTSGVLRGGVTLTADGVLDIDIPAVRVTGTVTVNGEPMRDEARERGALRFVQPEGGAVETSSFGTSGPAGYTVDLLTGPYDIHFAANSELCDGHEPPGVPCVDGEVRAGYILTEGGTLDVDVPAVRVTGAVTVGGRAMEGASSDRGRLRFALADHGETRTRPFGASGPAGYAVTLLPGTYEVLLEANEALCGSSSGALSPVPCIDGTVRSGLVLNDDGVLDLDLPSVRLSGAVTLREEPLPAQDGDRGRLVLALVEGGELPLPGLGRSGGYVYEVRVLPGTYDVRYEPDAGLCARPTPPAMPCVSGTILSSLSVHDDGVLDLDVPAVRVEGAVLLDGGALPDHAGDRGRLTFALDGGGSASTAALGATGPASYALSLLPGAYEVTYEGNRGLCGDGPLPAAPCMTGVVLEGVPIGDDGVLDVDIPSVQVEGAVTVDGEPMAPETGDRGRLVFRRAEGGEVETASFGTDGPGAYGLTLIAGTYVLSLDATEGLCDGTRSPVVPCVDSPLLVGLALFDDGVLDVDVPAVAVAGNVTVNGAPMADEAVERGLLSFVLGDGEAAGLPPLSPRGHAGYAVTLVEGNYVVRHLANAGLCGPPRAGGAGAVPCADQWVLGCEEP